MEIWDLYDEYRNKLDITMNKGDKTPRGCYRLAGNICIFNSEKKMLIQKRSSNKSTYPDLWDTTARGSAICGEDSKSAAKRELKEEFGIDFKKEQMRFCLTIYHKEWFSDLYVLHKEVDINNVRLNKKEVSAIKWASQSEILEMIEKKTFVPYGNELMNLIFNKVFKEGEK